MTITFIKLGVRPYLEVLELQERLFNYRLACQKEGKSDNLGDVLIFCEHEPVFTIGKRDCDEDFLSEFETIKADGIEVVKTNRGGKITYHGPGQLVCYFIFDINQLKLGVKDFVSSVEEVCLRSLTHFGISAHRNEAHPGIWVGKKKIVAVGFHISNGITMHGIAINVDPNMEHYNHIVPCGIRDMGVTSMREITQTSTKMDDLIGSVSNECGKIFRQFLTGSTEEKVRVLSCSS